MDGIVLLQLPLKPLWGTAIGFIILMTATIGAIGVAGRNLAVGAMAAYLSFSFYAVYSGIALLEPIFYTTLVLIFIGTMMKVWRLEGFETGS